MSLRDDAFTRHYLHEDGTITTALFAHPVNFQDNNGIWQDIDNTLRLATDAYGNTVFVPAASGLDISIPQYFLNDQLLTVGRDGYIVGFGLIDTYTQNEQAQAENSDEEFAATERQTDRSVRRGQAQVRG